MSSRLRLIGFSFSILILGGLIGWFSHNLSPSPLPETSEVHQQSPNKLISPLLECGSSPLDSPVLNNLNSTLQTTINKFKSDPSIDSISLYFRDLNNGAWLGYQEDELFAPASLLKVPVLIATLKQAELDPNFLTSTLIYNNEFESDENLPEASDESLISGESYPISTLLEKMIAFSDNISKNVIKQYLTTNNPNLLSQVYRDFGLGSNFLNNPPDKNTVNIKDYAGFFRILYNASYLNPEMSEYALSLLTKSTFSDGLVANLPKDLPVAHKFGFRELPNEPYQLHDCGIVYFPKNPYLLCIMSRGNNVKTLSTVLSYLSLKIYNFVSTNTHTLPLTTPSSGNLDL